MHFIWEDSLVEISPPVSHWQCYTVVDNKLNYSGDKFEVWTFSEQISFGGISMEFTEYYSDARVGDNL